MMCKIKKDILIKEIKEALHEGRKINRESYNEMK